MPAGEGGMGGDGDVLDEEGTGIEEDPEGVEGVAGVWASSPHVALAATLSTDSSLQRRACSSCAKVKKNQKNTD
jgi:hypothetical protein